jgi:hypothetical protein
MINGTRMRAAIQWIPFNPTRGTWAAGCTRDHPASLPAGARGRPCSGEPYCAPPANSNEPAPPPPAAVSSRPCTYSQALHDIEQGRREIDRGEYVTAQELRDKYLTR